MSIKSELIKIKNSNKSYPILCVNKKTGLVVSFTSPVNGYVMHDPSGRKDFLFYGKFENHESADWDKCKIVQLNLSN